jgi:hypothetical protein
MLADLLLLERLSDVDLALLAEAAGVAGSRPQRAARLRERPADIDGLLARADVFEALFGGAPPTAALGGAQSAGLGPGGSRPQSAPPGAARPGTVALATAAVGAVRPDPIVVAGPFLAFAVLLAQTPAIFAGLTFVPERVGRRSTVPVFEVEPLREFVGDPLRRLFLADLLASYTHVASGALWVKSRRGWRHRRFSELDPAQFAELILSVSPEERLVLYRRLGDLTLFLSGVFPDHVSSRPLPPIAVERLRRAVGGAAPAPGEQRLAGDAGAGLGGGTAGLAGGPAAPGDLRLLEWAGRRSYGLAWDATGHGELGLSPVLGYVAEHFRHARLILNFLTDRYLFEHREHWFALGS